MKTKGNKVNSNLHSEAHKYRNVYGTRARRAIRWHSQHNNQEAAGNINKEHKKTQGHYRQH